MQNAVALGLLPVHGNSRRFRAGPNVAGLSACPHVVLLVGSNQYWANATLSNTSHTRGQRRDSVNLADLARQRTQGCKIALVRTVSMC
jgi:hypothetical protein